jgi:hypothetical protein
MSRATNPAPDTAAMQPFTGQSLLIGLSSIHTCHETMLKIQLTNSLVSLSSIHTCHETMLKIQLTRYRERERERVFQLTRYRERERVFQEIGLNNQTNKNNADRKVWNSTKGSGTESSRTLLHIFAGDNNSLSLAIANKHYVGFSFRNFDSFKVQSSFDIDYVFSTS